MKLDVYSKSKDVTGSLEVSDDIFNVEVRNYLFWEVVNWQRAKRRAGTHKTKGRSEVRGGGRKPFRQKGTGRARQGTNRAPHFVGGGTVFGPTPRDYSYTLPKKKRRAALIAALSLKAQNQQLIVIDDLGYDHPKTKQIVALLNTFDSKSALLVDVTRLEDDGAVTHNESLRLSARNLPNAKYLAAEGLNVEDILGHTHLFMTQAAVENVQARLK